jgi:hypothetical protein
MSESSSNPVRQLRYDNNDADLGVPYLQALGVKYVMVWTEAAKREADAQPELTLVRQSGPWNVYSVAGTDLVVPLAVQPVVVAGREGDPRERNLELGMSWFQHQDEWAALPADDGPAEWQRIEVAPDLARRQEDRVDIVTPTTPIVPAALPAVTVSDIDLGDQDLRFTVDQVGVPVLVRMSYFPNWEVSGAEGPYRVAPNLMVVIPTDTEVHLTYGRSPLDITAYVLTAIGIALLFVWRRLGDVVYPSSRPRLAMAGWMHADERDDDTDGGTAGGSFAAAGSFADSEWDERIWGASDATIPMVEPDLADLSDLADPAEPADLAEPAGSGADGVDTRGGDTGSDQTGRL